jgi:hypothetical protein
VKSEFLSTCQVATPIDIVECMWKIAMSHRQKFHRVLDLGAGDGRFSKLGKYGSYTGYEIDSSRLPQSSLTKGARIYNEDAFSVWTNNFDLCIGNPPYIRANRLDKEWREQVIRELESRADVKFSYSANVFVFFITLALLRTKSDGLVIQLVPFEWVTRPSAQGLREFIKQNNWHVDVYRFNQDVFDRVLTTASLVIIDKSNLDGKWSYYSLDRDFSRKEISQTSGTNMSVLTHSNRHAFAYALRGLSPGGQDIFALTETERLLHGLKIDEDVCRCVTSLRPLPKTVTSLTESGFRKYYVNSGERCWLIRSDKDSMTDRLRNYLVAVGVSWKKYSTCTERDDWWKYRIHPVPHILIASGFTHFGPKIVKNSAKVVALGSVYAVFAKGNGRVRLLEDKMRKVNFEAQVVSHSNNLKKIEIKQLNSVIISTLASAA